MIRRVTKFGEPVLKEAGAPVTRFDDGLAELVRDMIETMIDADGIGLAAQQVGLPLQLFVVDLQLGDRLPDFRYRLDGKAPPIDLLMPLVVVNPVLEAYGGDEPYEEGCLSFPGIRGEVVRPVDVRMDYQDLDGKPHTIEADGLLGRVLQHEYDHCQGVLFTDRMRAPILRRLSTRLKKLRRETRDAVK